MKRLGRFRAILNEKESQDEVSVVLDLPVTRCARRIVSMKTLPESIVAGAFELSSARGADLLARLGEFDVWRGDLAVMREDEPRSVRTTREPRTPERTSPGLLDTLVLARAIELLDPMCRAALSKIYTLPSERNSPSATISDVDCENRLLEIYDSLTHESADGEATVPITQREDAAGRGSRRR